MTNTPQIDFAELVKQLDDDYVYFDAVPDTHVEYIMAHLEQFKQLIANLKYNAKYLLKLEPHELDDYIKPNLTNAILQSVKAKDWYIAQGKPLA